MEFLNAWRHVARVAAGRDFQLGIAPGRSGRLGLLQHPGFDELEVVSANLSATKARRLLDLLTIKFAHWPGFLAERSSTQPHGEGRYSVYIVFQHWSRGDQDGFLAEVPSLPNAVPAQLLPENHRQPSLISAFQSALSAEPKVGPTGDITQPDYEAVKLPGAFIVDVNLPQRSRPAPDRTEQKRGAQPASTRRNEPARTIVRSPWSFRK